MSRILNILKSANPECDFESSTNYLEDGLLDSLATITLIAEIEDVCGIEIDVVDLNEEDLGSEEGILCMIARNGGDTSLFQ